VPTVGELLAGAIVRLREAGSESARLDAEVLLAHALGAERAILLAHPELTVGEEQSARFEGSVERRAAGEPVAYIRGVKEFFGLAFATDGRALIPRPETERLVEAGRAAILTRLTAQGRGRNAAPLRIADIGTGSGAIIVTIAVELRRRNVSLTDDVMLLATDSSPAALELARENAVAHAVADVIEFIEADLLPPILPNGGGPLDVVMANLPYVSSDAIAGLPVAASFEPQIALDGGPDGLAVARRLLARLPTVLSEGGVALLEIGADQGDAAPAAVMEVVPGWVASVENDLSGLSRVLRVSREPGR
jgi:release factor glutamine methyltransferase